MEPHTEKAERTGIFEKHGDVWVLEHAGHAACVHDLIGLHYLTTLLANPGKRFSAMELRFACASKSRARRTPSSTVALPALSIEERARFSVSHAIRTALARIAACHTSLALHLKATIHTGSFFSYDPDPQLRIVWRTGFAAPDGSGR